MTRRRDKRIIPLCLGIFVAISSFAFLINRNNRDVEAADLSKFRPGNIISDYMMSNYRSMTKDEIQAFLTKKNPCNNRSRAYYDELVRLNPGVHWHWKDDHFVCISEELFGDGETIGEGKTAAEIIYETAEEYRINPQVLIVLIQKESGLITDPIPNNYDYRTMTGFGCPDTAPCSAQYFGFKNQIRKAAWLFREVLDGGWTNYPLGENYVQYSPNAACGGSIVNIENLATSSLYRYTPYQPNAAAIAAGTGTAPCGAYGNRNFYAYFSDWFGDPTKTSAYVYFDTPRELIANKDIIRVNPFTGEKQDPIAKGTVLMYDTKVYVNGKWYFRTAYCTYFNLDVTVPAEDVSELSYENITPVRMETVGSGGRIDPIYGKKLYDLNDGVISLYTSRIKRSDGWYYRTKEDEASGKNIAISERDLKKVDYVPFDTPRYMRIPKDIKTIDVFTKKEGSTLKAGSLVKYSSKIELSDGWYFRSEADTKSGANFAVPLESVEELSIYYMNFDLPRHLKVVESVPLINPFTKEKVGESKVGDISKYSTKIYLDDGCYYRTESDSKNGVDSVIPASAIYEPGLIYYNFDLPRHLKVVESVPLINPFTKEKVGESKVGDISMYSTKIQVDGTWYYRTESNSKSEVDSVIPASAIYEPGLVYNNFDVPRQMRVVSDAETFNPFTDEKTGNVKAGDVLMFTTKMWINGECFYRTEKDTNDGVNSVVPAKNIAELNE